MQIALITPAGPHSRKGNRNTAMRWAGMLRELGHRVRVQVTWDGQGADLMLALHARRSFDSIQRWADRHPDRPLVVTLTGTDLYRDIRHDVDAQTSLRLATRLIVLQDKGVEELAEALRSKTSVVFQSARPLPRRPPVQRRFEVCVIGHLREEKDPLRTALALQWLPEDSRIAVTHMGEALSPEFADQARQLMAGQPRYRWLGEIPHGEVRRRLARARVMVISSRMEGGANVVSEALAAGVPVIASEIPGNVGMLGDDYAGYYPCGDERELARLLLRCEREPRFYEQLEAQCAARRWRADPAQEKRALAEAMAAACAVDATAGAAVG